ncbi:MAG: hypothetical protein O7E55_02610 [Chloroflexi bacterium]|nr:hypothetical protein [Chloroflexota bacterium]
MQISKISALVRYSQDTGKGAWKVIELGAEATVSDHEHWKVAQSELYYQLGDQLRQLWNNGTDAALNSQNGAESHVEPPTASEPTLMPRPHWCQPHDQEWKRRTKDGTVWYSHRQGKGWCNEPEPAERR